MHGSKQQKAASGDCAGSGLHCLTADDRITVKRPRKARPAPSDPAIEHSETPDHLLSLMKTKHDSNRFVRGCKRLSAGCKSMMCADNRRFTVVWLDRPHRVA
jgi:hypothetical protein